MRGGGSEELFSELLDIIPMITLLLDKNLRVAAVFGDYEPLFAKPRGEIVGKNIEELVPYRGLREILNRSGERKERKEFELPVYLPGSGSKILKAQSSSVKIAGPLFSSEECKVFFLEDITERMKLEEQLLQAEKNAGMGELAASIAHELGNPLSIMSSTLQYISDSPVAHQDGSLRGDLNVVLENIGRMHELLGNLAEFMVPEKPVFNYGNLNEGISQILAFVQRECQSKRIEIRTSFDETIPQLWMDMRRIKQVFLNLIKNAVEAMPDGGSITISTQLSRAFRSSLSDVVTVKVEDTGRGISQENIDKIFKPFFSTKKGGRGLGLSLSQKIIREHCGQISVENRKDRGTVFSINIPVERAGDEDN